MGLIKYGKFVGGKMTGKVPISKDTTSHMQRCFRLTAEVESGGRYGTVMNYDGTGMTAGVHQAIATYPRDLGPQGPLFQLLAPIIDLPIEQADLLKSLFKKSGLTMKGSSLVKESTGTKLTGEEVRFEFSGSADGVCPSFGPHFQRCQSYLIVFHELFSAPETFPEQDRYAHKFVEEKANQKLRYCSSLRAKETALSIPGYREIFLAYAPLMTPLDLAMAVHWCYMVNAPGAGLKLLCRVVDSHFGSPSFPAALIKAYGTSKYGKWASSIPESRYHRTREWAMDIWPEEFFTGPEAVMPKGF